MLAHQITWYERGFILWILSFCAVNLLTAQESRTFEVSQEQLKKDNSQDGIWRKENIWN